MLTKIAKLYELEKISKELENNEKKKGVNWGGLALLAAGAAGAGIGGRYLYKKLKKPQIADKPELRVI